MSPENIRQWTDLLDLVDLGVAVLDPEGTITHWNRSLHRITGRGASATVGRTVLEVGLRADAETGSAEFMRALRDGRSLEGELTVRRADGSSVPVRGVAHPLTDGENGLVGMVVLVTEARRTGPQLAELRMEIAQLRAVLERRSGALPDVRGLSTLTRREREVTVLLRDGLRVSTIAQRLGLSQSTVRNHLSAVFAKLGVRSQAELLELLA
jgi:PAS domain S-box-containing protein